MRNPNSHTYYSFLLRLWQAKEPIGYAWRASVEQVGSGVLQGFANLDELMLFLRHLTSEAQEIVEIEKEESNEP
jgi:hypothetical protein